ncbi:MAG: peptidoglycan DD-metalloendopeptidase family protein [Candidatus Moraniibacteriota bacterium]|nr:MAG: peptidoglycan DD-metalloendopeptidase family protein [Candidatus Moranbacteria bacterium]
MSRKKTLQTSLLSSSLWASFCLLLVGTVTLSERVRAEDTLDTLTAEQQDALDDRQDELDDIKARIKAYKEIVGLKQRQGAVLGDQIEGLEAQAKMLELQIGQNQQALAEIQSDVQILAERISQKEGFIVKQRDILSEIMRGYYADQSTLIPSEFIVNASRVANPLQESEWKSETGAKVSEVLSSLKSLREGLKSEHAALLDKEKAADTLRLQLEEQDARLDSTKESKAKLLAKTQSEAQKYDALVDDLEKQREEIENEIESIESGKIDALDTKDIPAFSKGLLSYPLKNAIQTQGYGKTSFAKKSNFYKSGFHNGIDFGTATGTSVLAAADGKVIAIGNNGRYAYGRYIAVDHGNGLVTMYGHLSSVTRKLGDKVKRGDTIAKSGNTGNSTGPHVHFTVFSAKSFDIVPSKIVSSLKDIPVGATVNPKVYLP